MAIRRPHPLLAVCAVLVGAAVVAFAWPVVNAIVVGHSRSSVLAEGPQHLTLDAHQRYGIFVVDADNSGYSESCDVTDRNGRPIDLKMGGFDISSSGTKTLDYTFDAGAGPVVVDCSVPDEQVLLQRVPDYGAVLVGFLVAVGLGVAALVCLLVWVARRPTPAPPPPPWAAPGFNA